MFCVSVVHRVNTGVVLLTKIYLAKCDGAHITCQQVLNNLGCFRYRITSWRVWVGWMRQRWIPQNKILHRGIHIIGLGTYLLHNFCYLFTRRRSVALHHGNVVHAK